MHATCAAPAPLRRRHGAQNSSTEGGWPQLQTRPVGVLNRSVALALPNGGYLLTTTGFAGQRDRSVQTKPATDALSASSYFGHWRCS